VHGLSSTRRMSSRSRRPTAAISLALILLAATLAWIARRPVHRPCDTTYFPQGETAFLSGDLPTAIAFFRQSIAAFPGDPRPYRDLVDASVRLGRPDSLARLLGRLTATDPENACVHYALGKLAFRRQDLTQAQTEAERAISLEQDLGYAHLLLGLVHYTAGRPAAAGRSWHRSRTLFHREGDALSEALALNNLAMVHLDEQDYRGAYHQFENALRIQRLLKNRDGEKLALANMGLALIELGEFERAVITLRQALSLARSLRDPHAEWRTMEYLCDLSQKMGEYRGALALADSMIVLARAIDDRLGTVAGTLARATICNDMGDPVPALESCLGALAGSDSLIPPRYRSLAWLNLAQTQLRLGRLDSAKESFTRCDSLARKTSLKADAAMATAGLSTVARLEGDTTLALALGEQALRECSRIGYLEGEGETAGLVAELALSRGEVQRASLLSTRAVELSRQVGRRVDEVRALARRASVRLALGDRGGAERDVLAGEHLAEKIHSVEELARCETILGDLKRETDPEAALADYEAAMSGIESIHRRLRLDEFKAGYLQERLGVFYKAAELLVSLDQPGRALIACERSRARAFRDLLAVNPTAVEPVVRPELAGRARALEDQLPILEATLTAAASAVKPDAARVRSLERALGQARDEWKDVRTQILLEDPHFGSILPDAPVPALGPMIAALPEDRAVLEYFLSAQGSLCFVVAHGAVRAVPLPAGSGEISRAVEQLRRPLLQLRSLGTLSFDSRAAVHLREALLDPLLPLLDGITHLTIVPDGALHYLPFEMLLVSYDSSTPADPLYREFDRCRFLTDAYAVSYLPSAALLAAPPWPGRSDARADGSLLALACSAGPTRLAHVDEEVGSIARHFPSSLCLFGDDATEQRFKAEAPRFRLIHLSCHGILDESLPLYSGLTLLPDRNGEDDGILRAYEVLRLPLSCQLVTLSACETGLGRLYGGEGLLGLTRSFLYAGADQALVSLWSVNDESTALLMDQFYAGLKAGMEADDALCAAKRALRRLAGQGPNESSVSYSHPFFWAPFVLVGAPGRHGEGREWRDDSVPTDRSETQPSGRKEE
jgi:CHAT domain-containing protein/Tfp pilus assembly protein PilF